MDSITSLKKISGKIITYYEKEEDDFVLVINNDEEIAEFCIHRNIIQKSLEHLGSDIVNTMNRLLNNPLPTFCQICAFEDRIFELYFFAGNVGDIEPEEFDSDYLLDSENEEIMSINE